MRNPVRIMTAVSAVVELACGLVLLLGGPVRPTADILILAALVMCAAMGLSYPPPRR